MKKSLSVMLLSLLVPLASQAQQLMVQKAQLSQIAPMVNAIDYTPEGNLGEDNQSGDYQYNGQNQLIAADANGHNVGYQYYPNGLLAQESQTISNKTVAIVHYYSRNDQLVDSFDNANDMASYLIANNVVLRSYFDSHGVQTSDILLHNQKNSVIAEVSNSGVEMHQYNAYGTETLKDASGVLNVPPLLSLQANPLLYAGYDYLEGVSLYNLMARDYNPQLRTFMQVDSYAFNNQGLINGYFYGNNNPIMMVDLNGHKALVPEWAMQLIQWGTFALSFLAGPVAGFGVDAAFAAFDGVSEEVSAKALSGIIEGVEDGKPVMNIPAAGEARTQFLTTETRDVGEPSIDNTNFKVDKALRIKSDRLRTALQNGLTDQQEISKAKNLIGDVGKDNQVRIKLKAGGDGEIDSLEFTRVKATTRAYRYIGNGVSFMAGMGLPMGLSMFVFPNVFQAYPSATSNTPQPSTPNVPSGGLTPGGGHVHPFGPSPGPSHHGHHNFGAVSPM
ncbi:RHS repeat domain-containing protein [Cysteiniphilum halobium]|uniref:RHS repeat domain-containing protein n=1 Tax=Cysteiniphilum halobium TaxID=2219059 RepID=UPI003F878E43